MTDSNAILDNMTIRELKTLATNVNLVGYNYRLPKREIIRLLIEQPHLWCHVDVESMGPSSSSSATNPSTPSTPIINTAPYSFSTPSPSGRRFVIENVSINIFDINSVNRYRPLASTGLSSSSPVDMEAHFSPVLSLPSQSEVFQNQNVEPGSSSRPEIR